MRRASRMKRGHSDSGVVAVITAIVVTLALIPVAGLALTTYTRSGVQAEMVRSADSGALAGAAALSLVNLAALPVPVPNPLPPGYLPGATRVLGADGTACQAAKRAMAEDDSLGQEFARPPSAGADACLAVYSPSPPFGPCIDSISALIPTLPPPPAPLPGLPDPTVVTTAVRNLLPAFLENGVKVTLTYTVRSPFGRVIPGDNAPTNRTAVSTARRRFKRLLPPAGTAASPTQQAVVDAIRGLLAQLGPIVGQDPDPDLHAPLPNPGPVQVLSDPCKAAGIDLLGDLSDALNVDPNGAQRIACVTQVVLGLPDILPPVIPPTIPPTIPPVPPTVPGPPPPPAPPDCTDDVFRAQLAPNPP